VLAAEGLAQVPARLRRHRTVPGYLRVLPAEVPGLAQVPVRLPRHRTVPEDQRVLPAEVPGLAQVPVRLRCHRTVRMLAEPRAAALAEARATESLAVSGK